MAAFANDEEEKLRLVFEDLDTDHDGTFVQRDIMRVMGVYNIRQVDELNIKEASAQAIVEAGGNEFNGISWDMMKSAYQAAEEGRGARGVFYVVVQHVLQRKTAIKRHFPYFMVIISLAQIAIFIGYVAGTDCTVDDCTSVFRSELAYRMCCRDEIWRLLTYSLAHASLSHIGFNVIIQLVLGLWLEYSNCGSMRMALLYLIGTLGAALGSSVFDPEANVVGASGAVYAILGAWVAHLTQNWDTIKYAWVQAVVVFVLSAADLGSQVHKRVTANDESKVSFAGHFVGFATGIAFGTYILVNTRERKFEIYIRWLGIATFVSGVFFAVFWNIFFNYDPHSLCVDRSFCA